MSKRNILLIEPNYLNKYPPLGLMKLSAYHKMLGDNVTFFKGDEKDYLFEERYYSCLKKIQKIDKQLLNIPEFKAQLKIYLKQRRTLQLDEVMELVPRSYKNTIKEVLKHFAFEYKLEKKWDRIYITTLFTFYWKYVIKSVDFAKKITSSPENVFIGGILATLNPEVIAEKTGLIINKNILPGLLDKAGILDENEIIIDKLIPDYSIIEFVKYKYPLHTGFLAHTTKGCTRKCPFCAVPVLEPNFVDKSSFTQQIIGAREQYGDMKDLILMDNNVLGSKKLKQIIKEIKKLGFDNQGKFIEPNKFEYLYDLIKKEKFDINKRKLSEKLFIYLDEFQGRIHRKQDKEDYKLLLVDNNLNNIDAFDIRNIRPVYDALGVFIEKYRNKTPKSRYVDFNQGIDARYIDEETISLLSEIPIYPLRLAFDTIQQRESYEKAVRLADKHGIKEISNYILYNYNDYPIDLWDRLKLTMELDEELNCNIYSFPMKYIPVFGPNSLNREWIGKHWNRKYIRAIQCIINVVKGIGMTGRSFFEKAFGGTPEEFQEILMMPEPYIVYRLYFEENGKKEKWLTQFKNFTQIQQEEALSIIHHNDFFGLNGKTTPIVKDFIKEHYLFRYKSHGYVPVEK